MRKNTFTRIEPKWKINEKEISRLEFAGCDVYKYFQSQDKARIDGKRPQMERTTDGWRVFIEHFDSIDEAKMFYPTAAVQ